jgi:ppGpp synthetase/RelA/SpoT-type nucleotidyltranferase
MFGKPMNFDHYEAEGHTLYGELARFIRDQLEKALDATPELPHAQSIQYRRKAPGSLRTKLIQRRKLDSADIGAEVKDLAGVRLIFYGQDDVDAFVKARVLPELFTVQWEETKVHYPVEENDKQPYIAIHYIVSLNDAAAAQPELAELVGLRCEIQIQTLLDHAFAETYHDMVYKAQESAGFGTAELERLDQDMRRIRETYLKPAGYELDKVRRAHRRLMQGKALFDSDILKALDGAPDNNVRHELLDSLTNHVVPLYDDIGAVYDDIRRSAVGAVKAARAAPAVTRKTAWGDLQGETAASVAQAALTLLDELRYVDVAGSLDALIELYADEPDAQVRGRIVEVGGHLAENNMEAWRQVGPGVQVYLGERLGKLTDEELDRLQPLALTVWQTLLSPSVEGLTSKSDAVVLHKGTVTVSDALRQMRSQAIAGLVRLLDRAKTETQRLQAVDALQAATAGPTQSSYDGALAAIILEDMSAVSEVLRARIKLFAYDSLERIEEQVFYDYQYAGELGANAKMNCPAQAKAARAAALVFRDALNADEDFVRYKMLVGFQTVVAPQWDDPDFDFDQVEVYRREQIAGYQSAITEETFDAWRPLLARCAATDSNDSATFPLLGDFLREMARIKPSLAPRLLAESALIQFLPGILNGLVQSKDHDLYRKTFDGYLARGEQLASLAIHLQAQEEPRLDDAQAILKEAIARKDRSAIAQSLVLGVQKHAADPGACVEQLVVPALRYAVETGDPALLYQGWYLREAKDLLPTLSEPHAALFLQSQLPLQRIDHRHERMLGLIAQGHPRLVWGFLKARLAVKDKDGHQAVPYQLHALADVLGKDSDLAVTTVRGWFTRDDAWFRFKGGRVLHAVFHTFTEALCNSLIKLLASGAQDDAAFAIAVLQNYPGDAAIFPVIRAVVQVLPEGDAMLNGIDSLLGSTGVVGGAFGMVQAHRRKRNILAGWQDDTDTKIQAFAKERVRDLDLQIASEQRRAEQARAMRRLDYGEDVLG